jgi:hypothetical protein
VPTNAMHLGLHAGASKCRGGIPVKETVAAIAAWVSPIRWQWFITITFPWNVREETAIKKLRELASVLAKAAHAHVCYLAGQESKSAHNGEQVPVHFHLVLTSHAPISKEAIEAAWSGLVGFGMTPDQVRDHVLVEPYRPELPGIHYCLKDLNEDLADWYFYGLEYFLPGLPGPSRPNHRTLRRARRAAEQKARAGE